MVSYIDGYYYNKQESWRTIFNLFNTCCKTASFVSMTQWYRMIRLFTCCASARRTVTTRCAKRFFSFQPLPKWYFQKSEAFLFALGCGDGYFRCQSSTCVTVSEIHLCALKLSMKTLILELILGLLPGATQRFCVGRWESFFWKTLSFGKQEFVDVIDYWASCCLDHFPLWSF